MIVMFVPADMDTFVARWDGLFIEVKRPRAGEPWRIWVDGKRTATEGFVSSLSAKQRVERIASKYVAARVKLNLAAEKRPLRRFSPSRRAPEDTYIRTATQ